MRSSLRKELKEEKHLIEDNDEWKTLVNSIRNDLKNSELASLPEEEVIKRLKQARDRIWEEQHA